MKPMPRRKMRSGAAPPIVSPSNAMRPAEGLSHPMMVLSVVVLPAPLRPKMLTTSPASTASVRPCNTGAEP
jgi:hypothetical protein